MPCLLTVAQSQYRSAPISRLLKCEPRPRGSHSTGFLVSPAPPNPLSSTIQSQFLGFPSPAKWINSMNRIKNHHLKSIIRCLTTPECSNPCRRFSSSAGKDENPMTRDWLAQLWQAEKTTEKNVVRRRLRPRSVGSGETGNGMTEALAEFKMPSVASMLSRFTQGEKEVPVRRFGGGSLEAILEPLLARDNLVITRDIEWANIMLAFEQESRYVIVDPSAPQAPVGSIREQSNVIFRQLLRKRRPFVAHITDAMGNEIFTIRRPFWLINSTIYVEVDGKEVGVVQSRWHLWRRIYDLYLGNKQFAVVENPGFWNWTFTLKDENGNVLAQIDRDFRGFGLELFTDAGQYVIRFGDAGSIPKTGLGMEIPELNIVRPLSLSERALAVALAVSLDSDYFSRTTGGWGLPIFIMGE